MTRLQKLSLIGFGMLLGILYTASFKFLDPHYADPNKPVWFGLCVIYGVMAIWVILKKEK